MIKFSISMGQCLVSHDFIIAVFCCVDDLWHQITQGRTVRPRQSGFSPSLSDSEVNTVEIVGELSRQKL